jgi:hypothetical protein
MAVIYYETRPTPSSGNACFGDTALNRIINQHEKMTPPPSALGIALMTIEPRVPMSRVRDISGLSSAKGKGIRTRFHATNMPPSLPQAL